VRTAGILKKRTSIENYHRLETNRLRTLAQYGNTVRWIRGAIDCPKVGGLNLVVAHGQDKPEYTYKSKVKTTDREWVGGRARCLNRLSQQSASLAAWKVGESREIKRTRKLGGWGGKVEATSVCGTFFLYCVRCTYSMQTVRTCCYSNTIVSRCDQCKFGFFFPVLETQNITQSFWVQFLQ
jgi:hypothetical protein